MQVFGWIMFVSPHLAYNGSELFTGSLLRNCPSSEKTCWVPKQTLENITASTRGQGKLSRRDSIQNTGSNVQKMIIYRHWNADINLHLWPVPEKSAEVYMPSGLAKVFHGFLKDFQDSSCGPMSLGRIKAGLQIPSLVSAAAWAQNHKHEHFCCS